MPIINQRQQSQVRRALEKLLPSPNQQSIVKQATAAINQQPHSFAEKLLTLCDGLRQQGLHSYAHDLETKFLLLKKAAANSLYDLKIDGGSEALVDFAHPEKNKKLDKSWDDLGVVENEIEKHDKILAVIQKQPKGKLAGKHIINAVKIALADDATKPFTDALYALDQFRKVYDYSASIAGLNTTEGDEFFDMLATELKRGDLDRLAGIFSQGPNVLERMIKGLKDDAEPGVFYDSFGQRADDWRGKFYATLDNSGVKYASSFSSSIRAILDQRNKQQEAKKTTDIYDPANETSSSAPAASLSAATFLSKVQSDKQSCSSLLETIDELSKKPSISGDQQKAGYAASLTKAVWTYLADLNVMMDKLSAMGEQPVSNLASIVQGTKFFSSLSSYDQFKARAQSFHNQLASKVQVMEGW